MASRRMTITVVAKGFEVKEEDLVSYQATTWEQALANQQKWLDSGEAYIEDLISGATEVKATVSWEEDSTNEPWDDTPEIR